MLGQKRVNIVTNAKVSEISEQGVSCTDAQGNTVTVPAATVVSAFGYRAYNPLQDTAEKLCKEVLPSRQAMPWSQSRKAMTPQ